MWSGLAGGREACILETCTSLCSRSRRGVANISIVYIEHGSADSTAGQATGHT